MEAKVKEEIPDNEYHQPTTTDRRKPPTAKERKSPEQEETRVSPTPGPPSPQHNGTAALSSTESLSPPLERPGASGGVPAALARLRRFLSALHHFAADVGADARERVKTLICNLVAGTLTIEEFQVGVQECAHYPLRAAVPGFLRALLPLAQRDLHARARRAKQTPLQYIRAHEHLVLEAGIEGGDLFATPAEPGKRRASDPFYDQTNGSHDEYPPAKRPGIFTPSPFYHLPTNASLFDCGPGYHGYHQGDGFERRDGGITVRDVSSMNAPFAEPRLAAPGLLKSDDEWRNINTMLNCILSMVEKTKRALAILQQRGVEPTESSDIKRAANEIIAAAVRQTEERVGEVRRRAEDAVNQVKRQALLELQRAVSAAEAKAEAERPERAERAERRHSPPPGLELSPGSAPQQNYCWNCGRKAQETCSGCNAARYCGSFCQHKDWENHHQVCSGRDQKAIRTSPPATTTKPLPRSTTPITNNATDNRLSLTSLNTAERLLTNQDRLLPSQDRLLPNQDRLLPTQDRLLPNQDRLLPSQDRLLPTQDRLLTNERLPNTERIALATLSSTQGLIGGIGGKK